MIVASWSNVHGQTCSTSNMIAIAASAAIRYNFKCILTQTHFIMNNLETYLTGSKYDNNDVKINNGIDGLASAIKLHPLDKETIDNYSVPILYKKLTLLPGTAGGNRKVYIDEMGKTAALLLNEINKFYDLVFVDVNSGSDEVSRLVLEKSDIIMVNLCQNKNVLDNYMKSWGIKGKKLIYLLGSYDKDSSYNVHNLKHLYKFLAKDITGIIPYNTEFMDAQSGGNIIKFFKKNMGTNGGNAYFMDCVGDATDKLLRLTGQKRSEEKKWQTILS